MPRDEAPRATLSDPALDALWKRVLYDWENEATHGAFIEHCQTTDQLLEAAVRYRGMSGDHARGPSAQKRLSAIALLAIAKLESERTSPRAATRRFGRILLGVLFLAGAVALLLFAVN